MQNFLLILNYLTIWDAGPSLRELQIEHLGPPQVNVQYQLNGNNQSYLPLTGSHLLEVEIVEVDSNLIRDSDILLLSREEIGVHLLILLPLLTLLLPP